MGSTKHSDRGVYRVSRFDKSHVAERLDRVLRAGADADAVEAGFNGQEADLLRLGESQITQASRLTQGNVVVRAVVGGALGIASTSDLTDAGLDACTANAVRRAQEAAAPPQPFALAEPGEAPERTDHTIDAETAWLSTDTKARWLAPALAACERDDLALAGRFHTGLVTRAVRSSLGVDAYQQGSYADVSLSALERPAGHRASAFRQRLDRRTDEAGISSLVDTVRHECARAHNPKPVGIGAWDVVLMPAAVSELLAWLAMVGFSSRAMEDGMSFMKERIGDTVTGAAVNLVDDGSMPYDIGLPRPFDHEGLRRQRVELVRGGKALGAVHDQRSGTRAGCHSTGHAQDPADMWGSGAAPGHLHWLPGGTDTEALVGQLDRGLLITRFHYVNAMLEPRRAVMTGLLRDAAFFVENGRPVHAVEPMRFTDSMLEAFARIPEGGVGNALEPHGGWHLDNTVYVCPPILIRGLKFTSGR